MAWIVWDLNGVEMITEQTIKRHRYFATRIGDMRILRSVATATVVQFERIDNVAKEAELMTR